MNKYSTCWLFNDRERESNILSVFSVFCHTYGTTVHDQSHLSGLVDVAPESDARTHTPMAAVICSTSES